MIVKVCTASFNGARTPHCQDSIEELVTDAQDDGEHIILPEIFQGAYLYAARNALVGGSWAIDEAMKNADLCDYYWFIDDDVSGYGLDMLKHMISLHHPVVCGAYPTRSNPQVLHCGLFTSRNADCIEPISLDHARQKSPMYVDWSGLGCVLFHKSVFTEYLEFPWFYPEIVHYTLEGVEYAEPVGEDIAIFRELYRNHDLRPILTTEYSLIHRR